MQWFLVYRAMGCDDGKHTAGDSTPDSCLLSSVALSWCLEESTGRARVF